MDEKLNANLITNYIAENNLTIKRFCIECKISPSTYYKIINGKDFDIKSLFKIARKLDIPFCSFFDKNSL